MKRETKPFVQMKRSGGRMVPYYRLIWWEGAQRRERFIRLPEDMDSREFDLAYWSIRSGQAPVLKRPAKNTWAELVTAYKSHPKYRKLAASTRASYARILDDLVEKNGPKPVASLTRAQVRAIHAKYADTPRKADWMVQIISLLLNFARLTLDWKVTNVAEGIEKYGRTREFLPWPDWVVAKLPSARVLVRSAAELILGTGQRPGAAVAMRRDQFHGDTMVVRDEKGDQEFEIYAPEPLRAYLAALPIKGAHVLAKNLSEPVGYDAVERAFRAWRGTLGDRAKPYVLHGLRKLAIIRLAEAGCTDAQIQAITGQSPEMVAYYRRKASRKRLSRAGFQLLEQNGKET